MNANEQNNESKQPLVVCCGVGVDSVAMLVGMAQRNIRPDLILFADVGAERQSTYDYIPVLQEWLNRTWNLQLTVVRYQPRDFRHWPHYHTIEENILTNTSLAAIAYGGHTCSAKWKIAPMNNFIDQWLPALQAWKNGIKVRKAIGFEFSAHELRRSTRCSTFAVQDEELEKYELWFPLQEWKWNRERCKVEIMLAGLPVPSKSSCYFCTAMKPWEVEELPQDRLKRIVILEARASQRHLDYARNRFETMRNWLIDPAQVPQDHKIHKRTRDAVMDSLKKMSTGTSLPWEQWTWNGKPLTEGIWRKRVKGMRGATAKPGSVTEYIREKNLLPSEEIDRLIAATPTQPLTLEDFQVLGYSNWQEWLEAICNAEAEAKTDMQACLAA